MQRLTIHSQDKAVRLPDMENVETGSMCAPESSRAEITPHEKKLANFIPRACFTNAVSQMGTVLECVQS